MRALALGIGCASVLWSAGAAAQHQVQHDTQPAGQQVDGHRADEHQADEHRADEHRADEHQADEHQADEHWRHRVAVGFTPLNLARYQGSHAGLSGGAIDELNVGSLGVSLSYAYAPWRYLELKIQSEYLKPFPGRDALDEGLHEFRGVLGVDGVLPLGGDRLQLELGIDAGIVAWRLTALEEERPDFDASHALGWTMSWHGGLRGYFSDHMGVWGQAGFGVADASHVGDDGNGLSSRWPLRVTIGWADRF